MAKCAVCGGKTKTEQRDIERIIDGHPVRVLNLKVNICTECGDVTAKWWTSFDEIDRMLKARLERGSFDAVSWSDLISEQASTVMIPF
ncbi:MAG TPA: hypothetical protein PKD09_22090 [Aggregatilinea sp.]|uniref:hypothetical protein n=1 Tax=Aggregatilinea sp. TaxID=2806333 RepID=UPI002C1A9B3B|nr:hypothetical protein [Aggregatilinea sp.]HML24362.1 hypothetical protein [Aggregatilinea sp.]